MITGIVLGFIGVVGFSFIFESFTDYYDPREVAEHTAEYDSGTNTVLDLSAGCWVVNVEGSDDDYDVSFKYLEDGAATETVSDDCRSDFQASGTDVDFSEITTLDVDKDSEVLVIIECDNDDECENPLYFTNSGDVLVQMASDVGLWVVFASCCTGAILLPLGWLLVSINQGKDTKVQLTQQHMVEALDPYDVDKGFDSNQEILTTDQLYKIVRGELPDSEQQTNVPSPFSDVDTRVRATPKTKTGGSINKASSYTHENPPTDESWKNWDEA